MHKDLISEINLFFDKSIDLWDLVDEITYYSLTNFNSINNAIKYLEDKEDDDALIVEVLLWCVPNSPLKDLKNSTNSFYNFLLSIKNSTSDFYVKEIDWIYNQEYISLFKKDDLLFVINASDKDIDVILPLEYHNIPLLCINCNEEITVNELLNIPSSTFYIIQKSV